MGGIVARLSKDGTDTLALRIPSGALKGAASALAAAIAEEGRLLRRGAPSLPWRFESIVREGDEALLVGAYPGAGFQGKCPDEAKGIREGMPMLLDIARALARLSAEGKLPRALVSSGILVSAATAGAEGGELLILPPAAVAKALDAHGPEARAAAVARLSSPRAGGPEASASFFLAQAAYSYATGGSAFEREASERGSLTGETRGSMITELAAPRLFPALAALIDKALDNPNRVGLGSWVEALEAASAAGWEVELPAGREAELARRRASIEAETKRRLKRAAFFRKRGGILVGVGAALAIMAFVVGDMLRAQRGRPDYSALPPLELAEQYYAALESLDLDSLEACGEGEAVKADRNILTNLFVLTKTRMAYEGRDPLLHASDWVASGMGGLKEGDFLYGITGMEFDEEPGADAGDATRRFRATYSLWLLERKEDPSGDPSKAYSAPKEEKRVDELVLERGKKGWKIVKLDRKLQP